MNVIKLTQLSLTLQGTIRQNIVYVNSHHIKDFDLVESDNFNMYLTRIHWALGGFNPTYVKETPEEIVNLLNK